MKETKIKSKHMYHCHFLDLYEDDVLLENNKQSKRVVIKHPGGAAVLPLTIDNKIILTKQYRYPIEQVTIEIPAGKKDFKDEDPLVCAKRELEEETGYESVYYQHIFSLHPCVGYSDELLEIYLAKNCYKLSNPKNMDEDEFIEILIVDKIEAKSLIDQKLITDGKTIIAIQYYLMNL
jgi:ADP-ribose pyrophosphatase